MAILIRVLLFIWVVYWIIRKIRMLQGNIHQKSYTKPANEKPGLDPYEVLGLVKTATKEDIKKAYIKKMAEYHPDKVEHLGQDLKDLAQQKVQDINWAMDTLK